MGVAFSICIWNVVDVCHKGISVELGSEKHMHDFSDGKTILVSFQSRFFSRFVCMLARNSAA